MSRLPSTLNPQHSTKMPVCAGAARTSDLRPWMELSMDRFQTLLIDMRVNLRRRNVGVSEHFLNDPQIGAVAQKVRRKAVSQQMWVNVFLETCCPRFFL